jgi:hypothetical protein
MHIATCYERTVRAQRRINKEADVQATVERELRAVQRPWSLERDERNEQVADFVRQQLQYLGLDGSSWYDFVRDVVRDEVG